MDLQRSRNRPRYPTGRPACAAAFGAPSRNARSSRQDDPRRRVSLHAPHCNATEENRERAWARRRGSRGGCACKVAAGVRFNRNEYRAKCRGPTSSPTRHCSREYGLAHLVHGVEQAEACRVPPPRPAPAPTCALSGPRALPVSVRPGVAPFAFSPPPPSSSSLPVPGHVRGQVPRGLLATVGPVPVLSDNGRPFPGSVGASRPRPRWRAYDLSVASTGVSLQGLVARGPLLRRTDAAADPSAHHRA